MNKWYFLSAVLVAACAPAGLSAQEAPAQSQDTKIIIIEEKVDRWGNKTVNKTVKEGNFTDAEIEEIIAAESNTKPATVAGKGYLGVMIDEDEDGVRITEVVEDSPAEAAGLQEGDLITAVNDEEVSSVEGLVSAVSSHVPGTAVTVGYTRDGSTATTTATLVERFSPSGADVFEWDEDVEELRDREELLREREQEMLEREEMLRHHEHEMREHEEHLRQHELEMEKHEKKQDKKPRFGVYLEEVNAGPGVRVTRVSEGSLAEEAGVQAGDVITSFNKQDINSVNDLIEAVQDAEEGKKVKFELIRGGEKVKEKVVFGKA